MNKEAQRLLAEAPGLSRGPFNIVKEGIEFDPSDWVALLNLRDFPDPPKAGTWVTVRKGTYKGDVGFVCEDKIGWEGVTVLLVPRISTSFRAGLKRKRVDQPNRPALFNPASVKYLRNPDNDNEEELTQVEDNIFRFRGVTYEHGLVRRKYSLQSVSASLSAAPGSALFPFNNSGHPALSNCRIPRPLEWDFAIDERVRISGRDIEGTVVSIHPTFAGVYTSMGLIQVFWPDVLKIIQPGDHVEISDGAARGTRGMVSGIEGSTGTIRCFSNADIEPELKELKVGTHFLF